MRFPPLHRATLLRRYKRFLADVRFEDGREETVHVANPGSMLGLAEPGMTVWTSLGASKTRKLAHTLELVEAGGALVCVNTLTPNRLVAEALAQMASMDSLPVGGWGKGRDGGARTTVEEGLGRSHPSPSLQPQRMHPHPYPSPIEGEGRIPELAGYARVRREVSYGDASRVDFLLEAAGGEPPDRPPCWVEVKGVTLSREPGLAEWPDCVSARASRHLKELAAKTREGDRAAVLFVVLREDCDRFAVAADLDPAFTAGLAGAQAAGVEVLVYGCGVTREAMWVAGRLGRKLSV